MDDPKSLDLGWVKRTDLPPELADAAFAAPDNTTTAPVKSSFGWHILRVSGIKPGETRTLDQVKDQLKLEVARDQASDRMADIANSVDDALAGGASFDEVAQKFALKIASAADVDADGKDASGTAAELGAQAQAILKTAFATDKGQTSQLTEMGDAGYFMVQVGKRGAGGGAALGRCARPGGEAVAGRGAPAGAAESRRRDRQRGEQRRQEPEGRWPPRRSLRSPRRRRCSAPAATRRSRPRWSRNCSTPRRARPSPKSGGANGILVAQLQKIEPADPAKDEAAVQQLAQELGASLQGDTVAEYDQALRKTFPVTIDQGRLDKVMQ